MTRPGQPRQRQALDEAAFSALYQRLRNAASWGADDRRGALNNITQAQVAAAASDCPLPPTGYRRQLYNGVAADIVTAAGAFELSIDVARDGIAGRGVLLDIPRLRGALAGAWRPRDRW
jgi:hypothetical protein